MPRRRSYLIAAMLALASAPARAQTTPGTGPAVGSIAADFTGATHDGRSVTPASLAGPSGVVLVFVQPIDSCASCRAQLMDFQRGYDSLREQGFGLAAVSPDPPAALAAFASKHRSAFPLIADAGGAIIGRYGRRPSVVVLDASRRVAMRFEEAQGTRVTVGSLLARMGAPSPSPGRTILANHLDVTPSTSAMSAAPGDRFSIVADIVPGPRIHVYAPGNTDYIPISLRVTPHALLSIYDTVYPPSEEYHFVPLNERVQVFQKPFRIVRDLSVLATPEARQALAASSVVEIEGELDYQACDDRVCFPPETVPLRWRMTVAPPER
jgi:peroxiredoxin